MIMLILLLYRKGFYGKTTINYLFYRVIYATLN